MTQEATEESIREILALYLIFREADQALGQERLTPEELKALSLELRERVNRRWLEIYPDQEAEAFVWMQRRLDLLLQERIIPQAAAGTLREKIAARAAGSTGQDVSGPLATIWKTHLLYRLCLEAIDEGDLREAVLPRLKVALHSLVWRAFQRLLEERESERDAVLDAIQTLALRFLDEIVAANILAQKASAIVRLKLSVLMTEQRGADRIGGARCPVCGEPISLGVSVTCAACDTPHHADCWEYNGNCATFACFCVETAQTAGAVPRRRVHQEALLKPGPRGAPAAAPPRVAPGGTLCPHCNAKISGKPLRCWKCGAYLRAATAHSQPAVLTPSWLIYTVVKYFVFTLMAGMVGVVALIFFLVVSAKVTGHSCPYVYSHDGARYRLDADPLSGSFFEGAESTDTARLESLAAAGGAYRVRVSSERDERDFVDELALVAVDHPPSVEVFPTAGGDLVAVESSCSALRARSDHRADVRDLLDRDDGRFYVSRAADFRPDSRAEPRDHLELEFPRPPTGRATVVIRGHTSDFATRALGEYLARMGPGLATLLKWSQTCQSYPFRRRIADELSRLGLNLGIQVFDAGRWRPAGEVQPIGPAVWRRQAVRVELPAGTGPTVRLRLEMAPTFWEIDAVRLAPDSSARLATRLLRPREARCAGTAGALGSLSAADGRRLRLEGGQHVDVAFEAPPQVAGLRRTVLVRIKGFYEYDIGGRLWLDPLAVMRHRNGSDSLPRFALELLRSPRT